MTPILDNAQLGTDLDCQGLTILNILHMYPVPPGLVDKNDPTLYDPRTPPAASIYDVHVSSSAGIGQSKFLFNGPVPSPWLGTADGQAAQGNLAERVANKGVSNGYAAVDATGKIPSAHFSPTASPGTVNHVGLVMPPQFQVTSPIISHGVLGVTWNNAPDQSWFGVFGSVGLGLAPAPDFKTGQLPIGLIPSLDAGKFTTGRFRPELLPPGRTVTDPGAMGDARDYIGRDLEWHSFDASISYQPAAPKPSIVLASWNDTEGVIRITSFLKDSSLFFRVSNPRGAGVFLMPFIPVLSGTSITMNVTDGYLVEAYAAKAGYNNSGTSSYIVAIPTST